VQRRCRLRPELLVPPVLLGPGQVLQEPVPLGPGQVLELELVLQEPELGSRQVPVR
jgi:hypothetical protein